MVSDDEAVHGKADPVFAFDAEHDATALVPAFGPRWWIAFGCSTAVLALGLVAFAVQAVAGDPSGPWGWGLAVTGMRTTGIGGAPWGLYIVGDVFFIGVSFAGTAIGVLSHLLRIRAIKPLGRIAELISILSLAMAGMFVLADQGRPIVALTNLPLFTKPASPFFGTFVLLCTYLSTNLVFFFLDARADAAAIADRGGPFAWVYRLVAAGWKGTSAEVKRHERVCFWLAVTTLCMLIIEQSTAGLIFGTQLGRPGWFSDLLAPGFLAQAAVSGVGVLVVVAAALRHFLGLGKQIRPDTFRWLLRALLGVVSITIYFIATETFKAWYAAPEGDAELGREIVFGAYSPYFWTMVACLGMVFVISLAQVPATRISVGWAVAAGVLANVGVLLKRFLVVVPSQTRGSLIAFEEGSYVPTWVETGIAFGVLAFAVCACLVFVRIFPVIHEVHGVTAGEAAMEGVLEKRRLALTWSTLIGGMLLAAVSLLSSLRVGIDSYLDPLVPASPMLFILGLVVMLVSVVIYDGQPPPAETESDEVPTPADRAWQSPHGWSDERPRGSLPLIEQKRR